jgi:hypothetical protein
MQESVCLQQTYIYYHTSNTSVGLRIESTKIQFQRKKMQDNTKLLLVSRNFSRGRGVVPSLAERGEQSCQRGYYQFGMQRLEVWSGV